MGAERTQTFFLVEFADRVAAWCGIGRDPKTDAEVWFDLKGRSVPYGEGRPIHHMEVRHVPDLLGVDPVFGEILRRSAAEHLLDPGSDQGWIDPAGTFFGCRFYAHDDMASSFFGSHVYDLESVGWVRVHADSCQHRPVDDRDPTREQRRTLEALGFYEDGYWRRMPKHVRPPVPARVSFRWGDDGRLPPLGEAGRVARARLSAARRAAGLDGGDLEDLPEAPSPT